MLGGNTVAQGRGGPQSQPPPQPSLRNQVPPPILPAQVPHIKIKRTKGHTQSEFLSLLLLIVFQHSVPNCCCCSGSFIPVEVPGRQWRSEPSVWPSADGCSQPAVTAKPDQPDQPITGEYRRKRSV